MSADEHPHAQYIDDLRTTFSTARRTDTTAEERLDAATALIIAQERDLTKMRDLVDSLRAEIRALGGNR